MKLPTEYKTQQFQMEIDATFLKIDEGALRIGFPRDLMVAGLWVNEGRTQFKISPAAAEMLADRWDTHPDREVILNWLRSKRAESDFHVIYFVAAHVLAEWLSLPKRTVKEHRKMFGEIGETAQKLSDLLSKTEELYYRGGGYGLRGAFVCDLFTDKESNDIVAAVEAWNEANPVEMADGSELVANPRDVFPSMEDLLQRLSSAANRIAKTGPIHSQPNKRGALNGFFVRRMGGLLLQRYGKFPLEVLASIASIALNEAIDRELVAKLLK